MGCGVVTIEATESLLSEEEEGATLLSAFCEEEEGADGREGRMSLLGAGEGERE